MVITNNFDDTMPELVERIFQVWLPLIRILLDTDICVHLCELHSVK